MLGKRGKAQGKGYEGSLDKRRKEREELRKIGKEREIKVKQIRKWRSASEGSTRGAGKR